MPTFSVDGIRYRVKLGSVVPALLLTGRDCVTIRRTIYSRRSSMHRRTHAHEFAHIRQYARLGLFRFLWRYLSQLIRYGYTNHPLEREAHQYAHDHEGEFEHVGRRA